MLNIILKSEHEFYLNVAMKYSLHTCVWLYMSQSFVTVLWPLSTISST